MLLALFRCTIGEGEGTLSLDDEARLRFPPSSKDPKRSRGWDSSLDLDDSNRSRSSSPLVKQDYRLYSFITIY